MTKLSIVVPVYYNEPNLDSLYKKLDEKVFQAIDCDYELIMVDDGSGDGSYRKMCQLQDENGKIKLLKLSRNFGSHAAILAGLSISEGDCATFISADLQDPPEIILQMFEKWKAGNKVVLAVREDREEPFLSKFFANQYYNLMRKYAVKSMPKGGFDCCLIDRNVIDVLNMMEEKNTTIMGQILWSGFKSDIIFYVRRAREMGKSRWTLSKKIKLFIDSFIGFSYAPIRFMTVLGFIFAAVALVAFIVILVARATNFIEVPGYATLAIIMLVGFGIIMIFLGVLGEYMWRVFDETRKRPPFIVDEIRIKKNNIDK